MNWYDECFSTFTWTKICCSWKWFLCYFGVYKNREAARITSSLFIEFNVGFPNEFLIINNGEIYVTAIYRYYEQQRC